MHQSKAEISHTIVPKYSNTFLHARVQNTVVRQLQMVENITISICFMKQGSLRLEFDVAGRVSVNKSIRLEEKKSIKSQGQIFLVLLCNIENDEINV